MNTVEFKAWFEGFTENIKGSPTEKQWKRIQERVSEITQEATTYKYFYDHYWYPNRVWYGSQPLIGYSQLSSCNSQQYSADVIPKTFMNNTAAQSWGQSGSTDNCAQALGCFTDFGKAEAASL